MMEIEKNSEIYVDFFECVCTELHLHNVYASPEVIQFLVEISMANMVKIKDGKLIFPDIFKNK